MHHQLIDAPWRAHKKPVARRHHVLSELVAAGAELVVGGHIHQGAVAERHEFDVLVGRAPGCVISIAPGLGHPRPKRLGEARGCVAYRADERITHLRDVHLDRRQLAADRRAALRRGA